MIAASLVDMKIQNPTVPCCVCKNPNFFCFFCLLKSIIFLFNPHVLKLYNNNNNNNNNNIFYFLEIVVSIIIVPHMGLLSK